LATDRNRASKDQVARVNYINERLRQEEYAPREVERIVTEGPVEVPRGGVTTESLGFIGEVRSEGNLQLIPGEGYAVEIVGDLVVNGQSAGGSQNAVMVKPYLTDGATPAENSIAIDTAKAAAVAAGLSLCFDGVYCQIASEILLDAPGLRVWASTPAACSMQQTGTLTGKGVFRIAANDVTIDGFTLDGMLPVTGGLLDLTGSQSVDVHHLSAIKVDRGVERPTIRRIKGRNWFIVVAGFPYPIGQENSSTAASWLMIRGLSVEDIEVDTVWGGVRMSGLIDAEFVNVRGSYLPIMGHTQANTSPPHLFYISLPTENLNPALPKGPIFNQNIRVRDCHARDGIGGAPYSLRYTKGMVVSNLTADNCEGHIDMIGVQGFTLSGCYSMRDIYPKNNAWNGNRGSFSFFFCNDGIINPFMVEAKEDFDHGSLWWIGVCKNVKVIQPKGTLDLATPDGGLRATYISGLNIHVIQPEVHSVGESVAMGYQLANGFDGISDVHLDDPKTTGAISRAVDIVTTLVSRQKITYDLARIGGVSQPILIPDSMPPNLAPILKNTALGYPPQNDPRMIGWFFGERLSNNAALRTRWPSGHFSTIHTNSIEATATPPLIASNGTVTGIVAADFGTPNVEIESTMRHGAGSGSIGMSFRAIDTDNFLLAVLTSTHLVLGKRDGTVYSDLGPRYTLPVPGSGVWRNVKVRIVGTNITVHVDGVLAHQYVLTGNDATKFVSSVHGFRSDNAGPNSGWLGLFVRQA
jgi:hypothetical protein